MKLDEFPKNQIENKDHNSFFGEFKNAIKMGSIALAFTLLSSFAEAQTKEAKIINNTEISPEEKSKRVEETSIELKNIRHVFEEGQKLWNIKKEKKLFYKMHSNFKGLDTDAILWSDSSSKETYIASEVDKEGLLAQCRNLNKGAQISHTINDKKTDTDTVTFYVLDFDGNQPFLLKSISVADEVISSEKVMYPSEDELKQIDNQFKVLEQKILEEIKIAEAEK